MARRTPITLPPLCISQGKAGILLGRTGLLSRAEASLEPWVLLVTTCEAHAAMPPRAQSQLDTSACCTLSNKLTLFVRGRPAISKAMLSLTHARRPPPGAQEVKGVSQRCL